MITYTLHELMRVAYMDDETMLANYKLPKSKVTLDHITFRELFLRKQNPNEALQYLDTDEAHQGIWYGSEKTGQLIKLRRLSANVDKLNEIPGVEIEETKKPGKRIGMYRLKKIPVFDIAPKKEMRQTNIF